MLHLPLHGTRCCEPCTNHHTCSANQLLGQLNKGNHANVLSFDCRHTMRHHMQTTMTLFWQTNGTKWNMSFVEARVTR